MTEQTQASIHAVRALWAAKLEVASCANVGALESTDSDLRLRALTAGYAAIRLALSAFAVLQHPHSSKKADALYGGLFRAYDVREALLGPSQWTPFRAVLSENVYNPFDPPFVDTTNIAPGDANDCIEAWAWRNLKLYFDQASAVFRRALRTRTPDPERHVLCKRLLRLGVKAELAFWAMREKNSAFICSVIDEISAIERDFIERPKSQ